MRRGGEGKKQEEARERRICVLRGRKGEADAQQSGKANKAVQNKQKNKPLIAPSCVKTMNETIPAERLMGKNCRINDQLLFRFENTPMVAAVVMFSETETQQGNHFV